MIDDCLAELRQALRGPRSAKIDILAEVRDGLADAVEAYQRSGLDRHTAERRAVADFGSVRQAATDYQAELALAQGRRTALLICAILVTQPLVWRVVLHLAGSVGAESGSSSYVFVNDLVGWTGTVAILCALLAVFATSRVGVRHLGSRRRVTHLTGVLAFSVCGVFAVLGSLLTILSPATSSMLGPTGLPGTAMFLGIPLAGLALSGRSCLNAG
ncbi:permease prefix domain 1-containing protein [Salinispora vitiensis]|uniref:permease prefix domain 1-containing protein n=1 Tax=Salinispora vitiensis TaxID=999544 RepID=UPI00037C5FA0|nr:permease prefix domain 1-containing protein [Salinispora vitiensis]